MNQNSKKIELDELTQESFEFLIANGNLGDFIYNFEKFNKKSMNTDKDILTKLHNKIKKIYSRKFTGSIATASMIDSD
jgi:hypothetical protein